MTSLRTLRRVFRLWAFYGALDIAWMLRDLGSSVSYLVAEVLSMAAAISSMLLLAERFQGVGPWTREEVYFLLGYGVMATAIVDTLFGYNVAFISRRIGRGQLDHVLVQPQPMWLTLLTEGFSPAAGLPLAVPGLLLLVYGGGTAGVVVTPGWLALLALNLAASCLITLAFAYVIGSLAFWAPRAAEEINSSSNKLITQLRAFPLDGLALPLRAGLLTAAPIGFVAWLPARALLGLDASPLAVALTPLASVAFGAVALTIFRRGLREYARTGSQRYLSYGHRR